MSKHADGSVTRDAEALRSPDSRVRDQAAGRIWARFEPRLLGLVKHKLNPRIRVRADENDILQSMFKSFFALGQDQSRPALENRDELWRFLVWMAMCKVANVANRHQAMCRDVRKEQPLASPLLTDPRLESWLAELEDREVPTAEEEAIAREEFDRLLERLPEDLQQIFIWKLEGHSNAEIGRLINRTERTVELKMKIIRKSLERVGVTGEPKKHA